MSTYYITDTEILKRSLRLLDTGDTEADANTEKLLLQCLNSAENYVQHAVGNELSDFFNSDDVKDIYNLAVTAIAGAYYQNPVALTTGSVVSIDLVSNSLIGQMRGRYDTLTDGGDSYGSTSQFGSPG